MSAWTIYFLIILDSICNLWTVFTVVSLIAFVISLLVMVGCCENKDCAEEGFTKFTTKNWYRFLIAFLFFITCATFTPTTKQMCAIYVIPKIVNNERLQNIGDKSMTLVEKKFKEWVNDMTEHGKELTEVE